MAGLPKKETYNIHLAFRIMTVAVNSAKISHVFCCNSYRDYKDEILVCRRPLSISKLGQILILQTWSHDTWIEKHQKELVSLLFIMHTWGLLTSFCSRNHEVISSSYLPNKIIVVHSIWLRDKSGCVTMDTSDCTFSKTIKSLGRNYEDMANGLLADSIEIEMYMYIYICKCIYICIYVYIYIHNLI